MTNTECTGIAITSKESTKPAFIYIYILFCIFLYFNSHCALCIDRGLTVQEIIPVRMMSFFTAPEIISVYIMSIFTSPEIQPVQIG